MVRLRITLQQVSPAGNLQMPPAIAPVAEHEGGRGVTAVTNDVDKPPPGKKSREERQAQNVLRVLLEQHLARLSSQMAGKFAVDPAGKLRVGGSRLQAMIGTLLDEGVPGRAELKKIGDGGVGSERLTEDGCPRPGAAQEKNRTRDQSTPQVQDVVWKGRYFCHFFST